MKKILSKIFKKGRFFAHLRAERVQCQPPDFGGPLFEHFHKVNDQNQVVGKIGIKGYPLYVQTFWTHFLPLFEGHFLNPYVFKKSGFARFRISVYGRLNLRDFSGVRNLRNFRTPGKNLPDLVSRTPRFENAQIHFF